MSLESRFKTKCGQPDANGCIPWLGNKLPRGYGLIRRGPASAGSMLAHRCAYELAHGPIAEGLVVMHACDNPSCVNAAHLSLGTQRDNTQDMVAKGRHGWKDGTPWQKLPAADRDIVHAFRYLGLTHQVIANLLGISRVRVTQILNEVVSPSLRKPQSLQESVGT